MRLLLDDSAIPASDAKTPKSNRGFGADTEIKQRLPILSNPSQTGSSGNSQRDKLIAAAKSRIPGLSTKGKAEGGAMPTGAPGKSKFNPLSDIANKLGTPRSNPQSPDGQPESQKRGVMNNIRDTLDDIKNLKADDLKDPRKMAAELADKTLHLGKLLGHLLFIVWLVIMAAGYALLFFPAMIGLFMLDLLIISPKWCFRITKWILYLIPVVGEVTKGLDEAGISNLKVTISPVEKYFIIGINVMYFIQLLAVVGFIVGVSCWAAGGFGGTVASWLDVTGTFSFLKTICPK